MLDPRRGTTQRRTRGNMKQRPQSRTEEKTKWHSTLPCQAATRYDITIKLLKSIAYLSFQGVHRFGLSSAILVGKSIGCWKLHAGFCTLFLFRNIGCSGSKWGKNSVNTNSGTKCKRCHRFANLWYDACMLWCSWREGGSNKTHLTESRGWAASIHTFPDS